MEKCLGETNERRLCQFRQVEQQSCSSTGWVTVRARSDERFFFGEDQLSQRLWQSTCVHTQQRKMLKKLCYRIFVNVSLFVLQTLQRSESVYRILHL